MVFNLGKESVELKNFKPVDQIGVGWLELGLREKHYLQQVIDSNRLSYGPFSQRVEKLFAELHDCRFAAFCSSGTAALHLALSALKEKYGWMEGEKSLALAIFSGLIDGYKSTKGKWRRSL
jgi:cystathionine beta-lyase/cystathionine gamma-synthase